MSNLLNYLTLGKRLGELVTLPYNGDTFTSAIDGSVWKATNGNPLAYSATYSQLLTDAPYLLTNAELMNGPYYGNSWSILNVTGMVGGTAANSVWVMTGNVNFYYTSDNNGTSWTQRTSPNPGKSWGVTLWDGTNFVLVAQTTTTNGVYESTDGVNWTPHTAINGTWRDIIYGGGIYLAVQGTSSTYMTSTDRATWTSRTLNIATGNIVGVGQGYLTYNAGAGLFVIGSSTANTYQTSADGIAWDSRTTLDVNPAFNDFSTNVRFASNSTTTIAVGKDGYIAYSTDCINWTIINLFDLGFFASGTSTSNIVFWDGTRFVVNYGSICFYSIDGINWARSTLMMPNGNNSNCITPLGFLSSSTLSSVNIFHQKDVTSTTPTYIVFPTSAIDSITRAYVRIL